MKEWIVTWVVDKFSKTSLFKLIVDMAFESVNEKFEGKIDDRRVRDVRIKNMMRNISIRNDEVLDLLKDNVQLHSDVHFRSGANSVVIIASRVGNGFVKIYDAQFKNLGDVRDHAKQLEYFFGAKMNFDMPYMFDMKRFMDE